MDRILSALDPRQEQNGMYLFGCWSANVHAGEDDGGFREFILATNAYLFKVGDDGWRLFCQQIKINGDFLISSNYHGALLQIANENLLADAPDTDYVRQVMTSYSTEFGGELKTAEDEAKRWRRMFRMVCRERKHSSAH